MKKQNKGASLAQYGIIIALIALVLVPILYVFGETIIDSFREFYTCLRESPDYSNPNNGANNPVFKNPAANPQNHIAGGQLGGTPDNPVKKCENNVCTIDYGEFALQGIPEDFSEHVTSSGSSGGSDTLMALIEQIAQQLEEKGDVAGAQQYRDLANLGHFLAGMERKSETILGSLDPNKKGNLDSGSFIAIAKNTITTVPDNVKNLLPGITRKTTDFTTYLSIDLGEARKLQQDNPKKFQNSADSNICYKFIEVYDQIMSNPAYSENMKAVTQELYLQMNDITEQYKHNATSVLRYAIFVDHGDPITYNVYDPITGDKISTDKLEMMDTEGFLHPQSSTNSDINSALICVAGHNHDHSRDCHDKH